MRHRLFFGAVLFLMGVVAFADVSVEAGVDRQTLHVGDPVSYTLTITYDPSDSVADIPTGLNLSSLTVRDFSLKRGVPTGDGRLSDVALYVVTVFRLGRFVIMAAHQVAEAVPEVLKTDQVVEGGDVLPAMSLVNQC